MTLALTKVTAYGVEASEPLTKRFQQFLILEGTGANTDVTYDFGTYAGTFWTAVGGTEPGVTGLSCVKSIQLAAKTFEWAGGLGLAGKALISGAGGSITSYTSAASVGGAATEAVTVTGLAAADTILAVSQKVKGANSTALNGYNTQIADGLTLSWTANPGAGSQATVLVRKAAAAVTPVAGQYSLLLNATNTNIPDITFASGDAPTSFKIVMCWALKDNEGPIEAYAAA